MENNPQQLLIETQFEELTIYVRPDETHEWLMETRLVAEAYGVDESAIRQHKKRNSSELVEGKHYLCVTNSHAQSKNIELGSMVREQIFWTKKGIVRLGFFIKSARAKLFRDWAEDLIIRELVFNSNNFITI